MKALAAGVIATALSLGAGPNARQQPSSFCTPDVTAPRLTFLVDAFNGGRARAFARGFTRRGQFEPYNGGPRRYTAVTHRGIERIVRARHRAGDRWVVLAARPPVRWTDEAIYGLDLRVIRRAATPYDRGAKVIIVCSNGRIRIWLGPTWR